MLLVKKLNHHRVLSLLALALTVVPFTLPQAAVIAALPGTTQAAISVSESQQRIRQAFSSADQPFYLAPLATLYASRHMQPLWQESQAVQKFQQQLAEVALSGVQPQFTRWIERLTNPAITGFAGMSRCPMRCWAICNLFRMCRRRVNTWLAAMFPTG